MKILLINPPHTAIGSRVPKEHLPPFGLLCVGGPLFDAGYDVSLFNADLDPTPLSDIVEMSDGFDVIMIGHSGSTSAHPTAVELARKLKRADANRTIIYGGVYPTYHWSDVLRDCPEIDVIVRGEGEATCLALMNAIAKSDPFNTVPGIAFRVCGSPKSTQTARIIPDLDSYRIGWELIDFEDYSYWGGKKSVILQFSRGCPHLCTYCGQRGFWTKWRHRDPVKFAQEIAWLVRTHGIELINLADENPTSSRRQWKAFLEALIAEKVDVLIVGSTRADDIVRDADILHLYKKAGVIRFLLGLEGTDEATLSAIKKGGTRRKDREAIQLLRTHGMIGLCTFAVGFEVERDRDYWRLMRTLLRYDPDQIMSIYATPHRWTPFFKASAHRRVIQTDQRRWDYKHQVLETPLVPAWRVFLWVKMIECVLQLRPKAIWRTYFHPRPEIRHAMRWYTRMGRRVVLRELFEILFRYSSKPGATVAEFLGGSEQLTESAMRRGSAPKSAGPELLGVHMRSAVDFTRDAHKP